VHGFQGRPASRRCGEERFKGFLRVLCAFAVKIGFEDQGKKARISGETRDSPLQNCKLTLPSPYVTMNIG